MSSRCNRTAPARPRSAGRTSSPQRAGLLPPAAHVLLVLSLPRTSLLEPALHWALPKCVGRPWLGGEDMPPSLGLVVLSHVTVGVRGLGVPLSLPLSAPGMRALSLPPPPLLYLYLSLPPFLLSFTLFPLLFCPSKLNYEALKRKVFVLSIVALYHTLRDIAELNKTEGCGGKRERKRGNGEM